MLGGSLTGPLFEGGRLRAQYRQAVAAWEQAKLQYQQTALIALLEVSNALISREKLEGIRAQQERAVAAYLEAVKVSMQRFREGRASYYEVLSGAAATLPRRERAGPDEAQPVAGDRAALRGARRRLANGAGRGSARSGTRRRNRPPSDRPRAPPCVPSYRRDARFSSQAAERGATALGTQRRSGYQDITAGEGSRSVIPPRCPVH